MVAQTYGRIRSLTNQIREATKVTDRRKYCRELRELLGDQHNREMLLQEACGKKALASVWTTIIQVSLVATDRALARKTRTGPSKDDINVPYYMLLRLDEFSRFAKTESLLTSQLVRELLQYCLSNLANDAVMREAGIGLFQMLDHMCSRPDYVTHFRAGTEIEKILSELEERLKRPDGIYFESAAKAFETLLRTTKTLGMGMHLLIPRCLALIGNWCHDRLQVIHDVRTTSIIGVESMFSAAAIILSCHPEHAIYELSVCGRDILSLAKQCYPMEMSKRSKEAIIEYFLAHL